MNEHFTNFTVISQAFWITLFLKKIFVLKYEVDIRKGQKCIYNGW